MNKWREFLLNFERTPKRIKQGKAIGLGPAPWRKFYRREFLNEFHIRYPEGDFFYEDTVLHWRSVVQAKSFAVVDMPLIIHREGRAGQTMMANPERFWALGLHDRTIYDFLVETGNYEEFKLDFLQWIMYQCKWLLPKLGRDHKPYLSVVSSICKKASLNDYYALYKKLNMSRAFLCYNYVLFHSNYIVASSLEKILRQLVKIKHFFVDK